MHWRGVLVLCVLVLGVSCGSIWTFHPTESLCLDGTKGGFWVKEGNSSSSWLVAIPGGPFCLDEASCKALVSTPFGSSKTWGNEPITTVGIGGALQYDGGVIVVGFCSADFYIGDGRRVQGYYRDGKRAVIEALALANHTYAHFRSARDVTVLGWSSGGVGIFQLAPQLMLPKETRYIIDSSFFLLDGVSPFSPSSPSMRKVAELVVSMLGVDNLNHACVEALKEQRSLCLLSNIGSKYWWPDQTLWIVQPTADKVLLELLGFPEHLEGESLVAAEKVALAVEKAVRNTSKAKHFIPNSLSHVLLPSDTYYEGCKINGLLLGSLFTRYMKGESISDVGPDCTAFGCNLSCGESPTAYSRTGPMNKVA